MPDAPEYPWLTFDEKQIQELIARRHPEFKTYKEHWAFCEASYRGGRAYLNKVNVFRFYKEGEQEFKDRVSRTYRANHTKRVVDTVNQYLFKQAPHREAVAPEKLRKFWKKATRTGIDMDRFGKDIDKWLSVFGVLYVVVDRSSDVAASRSEEKNPYAYMVFPTHMLDAAYDEDGKLVWCLIAEDVRNDATPTSNGAIQVRFRLWTRNEWYLFVPDPDARQNTATATTSADQTVPATPKYVLGDQGHHGLGEVPVVTIIDGEGTTYSAPSLVNDIVYMDRALVNYGSMLDEIVYEQTFSQLCMPAEGILPGTTEAGNLIAAAKNRIFLYSGGDAGNRPGYISPDAAQATLLIEAMSVLMKNIYAITGTDNGDAGSNAVSTGKSYASGVVRSIDHAAIENMLLTKAQHLEFAEDAIARLVLLWMGEDDPSIDENWVRYPTKFDVRGLSADLDVLKQLTDIGAPIEVMREQMKTAAEKLFPRFEDDEMADIYTAIDKWVPKFDREMDAKEEIAKAREELSKSHMEQAATQADTAAAQIELANKEFELQKKVGVAETPASPIPTVAGKAGVK